MSYVQRIIIDHNASAIMAIECVDKCEKQSNGEFLYHYDDAFGNHGWLNEGDTLCKDKEGLWHSVSKWHKMNLT